MKRIALVLFATVAWCQTQVYTGLGNSSPYTDTGGIVWAADSGCTTSTQFTSNNTIQGTNDPTLYQHGRLSASAFSCTYTVANNTFYNVTLKFANTQNDTRGSRIFNIFINNALVRSGFDIAATTINPNTAFDLGFIVSVGNGQISVNFQPTNGGALIDAIGITATGAVLTTNNTFTGTNTFTGPVNTCRFNNIRIVDGICFAKSAAGINAADADLNTPGEIWVPPGVTATDAQISIGQNHVLKIFGQLTIEANSTKGPILLANGARLTCSYSFPPSISGNVLESTASTTVASMVRLTTQDGSQAGNSIDGCNFFGNGASVTNGVIDASGMTSHSIVRDNSIASFNSGWGIFIQDIQSGAAAGTSNVQIMSNQISPAGTGGCIEILHSSTNAASLNHIDILDTNCAPSSSVTGASVLIQNNDTANGSVLGHIAVANLTFQGANNNQPGLSINGVQAGSVKGVWCNISASSTCVTVPNNAANQGVSFDNLFSFTTNVFSDTANSVTVPGQQLLHYDYVTTSNGVAGYYNNVSYLKVNGLAPASATGTGFGTGPTFALDPGSTDNGGIIQVTTGTTPSSSGVITLNFNTTQTAFGTHAPPCVFNLASFSGVWNARATVIPSQSTTSLFSSNWDNNAVNLTASTIYDFTYWCAAK